MKLLVLADRWTSLKAMVAPVVVDQDGRLEDLVRKLIVVTGVIVFAMFASWSVFAQGASSSAASQQAELVAAWQAASKAGRSGPGEIALIDQASLKLGADYFLSGSMNLTYNGLRRLEESIQVTDDADLLTRARHAYEDRWTRT